MMHLWRSDLRQLKRILRDLAAEPDAHAAPTTDDAADRAGLEAWLVGILSSRGDVSRDDLDMLVSMADETQTVGAAKVYVARVHDVLAPHRALLEFLDSLDSQITEHCRSRAYSLTNAEVRGVYYRVRRPRHGLGHAATALSPDHTTTAIRQRVSPAGTERQAGLSTRSDRGLRDKVPRNAA